MVGAIYSIFHHWLQHTVIFRQHGASSFVFGEGPILSQHDNKSKINVFLILVWKNLTGLHRALNSTPSNTFGMNWNSDCEPGLIAQHQCPTSLMLVAEWKQVPAAMFQHLVESLPRRVEAVIAAKGGPTPF